MIKASTEIDAGQRGPADHAIREQIVSAANAHFSRYGYGKTTVSDLAEAIGFSKAYIYKFFDSKQAIGEAICSNCLAAIGNDVEAAIAEGKSSSDKLRRMFRKTVESSVALFFEDRKLYDIAAHSASERWHSSAAYLDRTYQMLSDIIVAGRNAGEFERKTALDETCRAILQAMQPFMNPVMLQYQLDEVPDASNEVIALILRSLAP
jgi:AcrR family transcriptional regulator